jgi:hypothetical protein
MQIYLTVCNFSAIALVMDRIPSCINCINETISDRAFVGWAKIQKTKKRFSKSYVAHQKSLSYLQRYSFKIKFSIALHRAIAFLIASSRAIALMFGCQAIVC